MIVVQWTSCVDSDGSVFFFNAATHASQWESPFDDGHGLSYYGSVDGSGDVELDGDGDYGGTYALVDVGGGGGGGSGGDGGGVSAEDAARVQQYAQWLQEEEELNSDEDGTYDVDPTYAEELGLGTDYHVRWDFWSQYDAGDADAAAQAAEAWFWYSYPDGGADGTVASDGTVVNDGTVATDGTAAAPVAVAVEGAVRSCGDWHCFVDGGSGLEFFFNAATGETVWDPPLVELRPPLPASVVTVMRRLQLNPYRADEPLPVAVQGR